MEKILADLSTFSGTFNLHYDLSMRLKRERNASERKKGKYLDFKTALCVERVRRKARGRDRTFEENSRSIFHAAMRGVSRDYARTAPRAWTIALRAEDRIWQTGALAIGVVRDSKWLYRKDAHDDVQYVAHNLKRSVRYDAVNGINNVVRTSYVVNRQLHTPIRRTADAIEDDIANRLICAQPPIDRSFDYIGYNY